MNFFISPSVGVARLGNSTGPFYLAPKTAGGLPFEADQFGNNLGPVKNFKDASGMVRRQGQPFTIMSDTGGELTLDNPLVASITWTVHLANKKAAWYQFSEEDGNLLFGPDNSYQKLGTKMRNPLVLKDSDRQKLIIDPGPRTVTGANDSAKFTADTAPAGYPVSFPGSVTQGTPITTLGEVLTDSKGRLVVLGGYGNAGGKEAIKNYGGQSTWHDDIADGPVYCTITFNRGLPPVTLKAWCIVGSPDFAPEIVNISTLADTMFDVAVRNFNFKPDMYSGGQYNHSYMAIYERDILPILQRMGNYQWVANVQPMQAFASNIFDFSDASDSNKANRLEFATYFRQPNGINDPSPNQPSAQLFAHNQGGTFPLMPVNSGSNSVSNQTLVKFLALNDTQYFLLGQWAIGKFTSDPQYLRDFNYDGVMGAMGNCVGLPMCPGIEATWNMQNPNVYAAPFVINDTAGPNYYNSTGLTPMRDECNGGGCEPGDLTKRMACPWQADFFQCTIQYVNFTDASMNKTGTGDSAMPLPPTYYSYWWPPQSPWDTLVGESTPEGQAAANSPMGQQLNYARGINSFTQMVEYWFALAFIRNQNTGNANYPFFTETERNNELFTTKNVGIGSISGNTDDNETTIPVFYIQSPAQVKAVGSEKAKKLAAALEARAFKKIEMHPDAPKVPRSGTRNRR
ncbi:CTQ-dependent lysine 6-oxidase LodA [Paraflavitalea pollutisoli]|uniref:CTQ-dependent lysine 6-oxidase LodA n=1 Tax=Paraflavitalea pollutisoli TaxID=3034143 RepID=UPI0023EC8B4C|nr:CTQ-dependent lysine 6-oxidase LodA [Paraflavitalea sp. H1-2-19X]